MAYYSNSSQYIDLQFVNKDQIQSGNFRHHREWHWAFEVWAYEAKVKYPGRQPGWVPHFNIMNVDSGIQYHVYFNHKFGYYEAVPNGMRPRGY